MNTTVIAQQADLESRIETERKRADAAERKLRHAEIQIEYARALVREMDANRDSLGDACRICGERIWSGPNGSKRPHHSEGCAVQKFLNGEE